MRFSMKSWLVSIAVIATAAFPSTAAFAQQADDSAPQGGWSSLLSFFHLARPHPRAAIEMRKEGIAANQNARNQILEARETAAQAVFHRKRDIVSGQLDYALRALADSRDRLAAFIASSTDAGIDTASSTEALTKADDKIAEANRAAELFGITESPADGDRRLAETTADIRAARAAIEAAIRSAAADSQ